MQHDATHNPLVDHLTCGVCEIGLRRALNKMADLPFGPADADALVRRLRELADEREVGQALDRYLEVR